MTLKRVERRGRIRWRKTLATISFLTLMLWASADAACAAVTVEEDSQCNANLRALRETDDFATGARWILTRDPVRPGAPGRWCRPGGRRMEAVPLSAHDRDRDSHLGPASHAAVVHGGDPVTVVDRSDVVEAQFDAIALSAAFVGNKLSARLKFSGRIVRVVALGRGRAVLSPDAGARP